MDADVGKALSAILGELEQLKQQQTEVVHQLADRLDRLEHLAARHDGEQLEIPIAASSCTSSCLKRSMLRGMSSSCSHARALLQAQPTTGRAAFCRTTGRHWAACRTCLLLQPLLAGHQQ